MNILFRCDASVEIGTGHVMRCLTLADELNQYGAQCHFICREHKGNLVEFIAQKGHHTYALPLSTDQDSNNKVSTLFHAHWLGATQEEDALQTIKIADLIKPDWLIVDHYALDINWELRLREYCKSILVIDDLADRHHDCDILVDQTYGRKPSEYFGLIPASSQILCGTEYALLRPEFKQWRDYSLKRRQNGQLNHLLINLGGVDKDNITTDILEALKQVCFPYSCQITVVMGATAPWLDVVKQKSLELPWAVEVKSGVSNMAELMANSDLAIGAAGATTWERCCLGLPTLMLVIADNQIEIAKNLEQSNSVKIIYNNINLKINIKRKLLQVIKFPKNTSNMSKYSAGIVDGEGVYRVICYILKET